MYAGGQAESGECFQPEHEIDSLSGITSNNEIQSITVTSVKEISPSCICIQSAAGSFFMRGEYLETVDIGSVRCGTEISGTAVNEIIDCSMTVVIERHALLYIGRCEQSRFGLTQKLICKGYSARLVEKALNYLEGESILSDVRFARAWLNNRLITHKEGRVKLCAGLLARGIDRKTAEHALDELFDDISEEDLLVQAYEKCCRIGIANEKKEQRLLRSGFSARKVKKLLS